MRLFVAVWPTEPVVRTLSEMRPAAASPELRWVPLSNWHVTLAFLGSVPDDEHGRLVDVLRSVGASTPACTATLGPDASTLGPRVLCLPVAGLDQLAGAVRDRTAPFNRSLDLDQPFVGHLTLARAQRGRSLASITTGLSVTSSWPVTEIRLVSSVSGRRGVDYLPTAIIDLEG